jgi:hypothetical protein
MEAKIKLELPTLPNYLRTASIKLPTEKGAVDVSELTEAELRQLGAEWTEALIKHADERRNNAE